MKKIAPYIYFPLIIVILLQLISWTQLFRDLESKISDQMFNQRGTQPISGDIVIVGIDDETFSSLDMQWPFPRTFYAHMIDNLESAGVKQIIFDVEFTETAKNPMEDNILADTAAKYNNVIFCGKLIKDNIKQTEQLLSPVKPITDKKLNWGIVNIYSDPDGFIRKYTLFEPFGDAYEYSIGIASLANERVYQDDWKKYLNRTSRNLKIGTYSIPIIENNLAIINYYGPAGTFKTYAMSSILDDSTFTMPMLDLNEFDDIRKSGALKNKTVLIGASIDELHDNFNTPFFLSSKVLTPGVEIHASFLEMVHHKNYLYPFSEIYLLIILFILAVLLYAFYSFMKPQFAIIITLILIALYIYITYFLFVHDNLILPVMQFILMNLATFIVGLVGHYIRTNRERKFIKGAFSRYMAPELVQELLKNPKSLQYGGKQQEITVLFSDIRSFTTYAESHTAEETVSILHEYLTAMVDIIIQNKGILDKFVGDEVMALYGTPVQLENDALSACKTAIAMYYSLKDLQDKWKSEGKQIFEIGIGINTGNVIVGNLGSDQIFDYTAIGDSINLGARLEGLNKEFDNEKHIIISEFTLEKVKDMVEVKYLSEVNVKGKMKAVKIYALLAVKDGF